MSKRELSKEEIEWLNEPYHVSYYQKFETWVESLWMNRKVGFRLGNFLLVLLWIVIYGPVVGLFWLLLFRLSF
tara:strand:- start:246 stop:464 length:219 start_codon:yes stop_codon:yes gene_type:complete